MIELGRFSRQGTITIATANTEYNFKDDVIGYTSGQNEDFTLTAASRGFLLKARNTYDTTTPFAPQDPSAIIRWSYATGVVTDTTQTGPGYITIGPGDEGGEVGICFDALAGKRLNVYVSSPHQGTIIEVRVFQGF